MSIRRGATGNTEKDAERILRGLLRESLRVLRASVVNTKLKVQDYVESW